MGATQMAYGYCGECRDFYAAQADFDEAPDAFTPPRIMGGGWMRCCGASLRAWAVYQPAPWTAGESVPCVYQLRNELHGMRLCPCGYWHWAKATCDEKPPA
ncbi:hypothetical protein [Streptomyces sp. NBC_00076]|uniref:hypothetical protein n=2 Tax=unclassified Streptomyces TaxID=2593676 RepID=UPI00324D7CAB